MGGATATKPDVPAPPDLLDPELVRVRAKYRGLGERWVSLAEAEREVMPLLRRFDVSVQPSMAVRSAKISPELVRDMLVRADHVIEVISAIYNKLL